MVTCKLRIVKTNQNIMTEAYHLELGDMLLIMINNILTNVA